jgi:hypothetical protein
MISQDDTAGVDNQEDIMQADFSDSVYKENRLDSDCPGVRELSQSRRSTDRCPGGLAPRVP